MYRALGHLSAAAKYLVVRFGLHPLLYRSVRTISTGEMRKVLLARALGTRPRLLVLDNAFDGLDAPSRASLAELVSMTITGFGRLLVQGVDASATAHTQVLLLTAPKKSCRRCRRFRRSPHPASFSPATAAVATPPLCSPRRSAARRRARHPRPARRLLGGCAVDAV